MKKNNKKGNIFKAIALIIDVGVPLTATLTQFPVWIERSSEATMSGICLMLICVSSLPFFKQLKEYFKSPSAWVLWGGLFLMLFLLRNIIDQILIVAFVGFVANIIGAGLFAIGDSISKKSEENK